MTELDSNDMLYSEDGDPAVFVDEHSPEALHAAAVLVMDTGVGGHPGEEAYDAGVARLEANGVAVRWAQHDGNGGDEDKCGCMEWWWCPDAPGTARSLYAFDGSVVHSILEGSDG